MSSALQSQSVSDVRRTKAAVDQQRRHDVGTRATADNSVPRNGVSRRDGAAARNGTGERLTENEYRLAHATAELEDTRAELEHLQDMLQELTELGGRGDRRPAYPGIYVFLCYFFSYLVIYILTNLFSYC